MCKGDYSAATTVATDGNREVERCLNNGLVEGAGKVPLDKPMGCGRGIVTEVKNAVLKWWIPVSYPLSNVIYVSE